MACPAVQYFYTLSHKRQESREKKAVTDHEMCALIFPPQISSEKFFILKRIQGDIMNAICKAPVILVIFCQDFNFPRQILEEKYSISNVIFSHRFWKKIFNIKLHLFSQILEKIFNIKLHLFPQIFEKNSQV
jgi:hypothetical protein